MNKYPATRKEAKEIHSGFYETGKACKHGHYDKRITATGECWACNRKNVKRWNEQNPEKVRQHSRDSARVYREKYPERNFENNKKSRQKNPAQTLLTSARARAKKYGLSFDLTIDDIVIPDVCPVFGMPLFLNDGYNTTGRTNRNNSPSLDKIVPSKGYVKGNVVVVSNRANRLKSDATIKEMEALVEFYKQYE